MQLTLDSAQGLLSKPQLQLEGKHLKDSTACVSSPYQAWCWPGDCSVQNHLESLLFLIHHDFG